MVTSSCVWKFLEWDKNPPKNKQFVNLTYKMLPIDILQKMLESFDDAKPSGFMGFNHVPKQAYISIHIQK